MFSGVNIGHERFEAICDELYGPAKNHRRRRCGNLVTKRMNLQTERSTDIRRDDPHIVFRNVEGPREYRLNHMRALVTRMNGQTSRTRIVVGQEGARLQTTAVCRPKLNDSSRI